MAELLTAAEMQAIERAAMAAGEVSGLELMERAGRGVVEAIFETWPDLETRPAPAHIPERGPAPAHIPERGPAPAHTPERGPAPAPPEYLENDERVRRAVVLCGPGNNGGDGFVVARLLRERGWEIDLFLYGDPERLPPDAKANYRRWCGCGRARHLRFPEPDAADVAALAAALSSDRGEAVLIDGLFGTGLVRPLSGLRSWLEHGAGQGAHLRRVAIDIPSGLCSDSGRVLAGDEAQGAADLVLPADLTVSFHRAKAGLVLDRGPEVCGQVRTWDIGLEQPSGAGYLHEVRPDRDGLDKGQGAHKYDHGHALVLSGGAGRTGAARLAARSALRVGAGLVTLGAPPSAMFEMAAGISALMLRRIEGADGLAGMLADERLNALCLGPGLGLELARELVPVAVRTAVRTAVRRDGRRDGHPARAVVLDADALTAYREAPEALFGLLHAACVLTPHGGEFARLFPDLSARLQQPATRGPAFSRADAVRQAARRAGCTVLLKGPDTVIAAPDGRCVVNAAVGPRAAPWLATAGSGDVLAGIVTGLLARRMEPFVAAATGAWLHVEAARAFGPGLIAEDLPEQLPKVFRRLGL